MQLEGQRAVLLLLDDLEQVVVALAVVEDRRQAVPARDPELTAEDLVLPIAGSDPVGAVLSIITASSMSSAVKFELSVATARMS